MTMGSSSKLHWLSEQLSSSIDGVDCRIEKPFVLIARVGQRSAQVWVEDGGDHVLVLYLDREEPVLLSFDHTPVAQFLRKLEGWLREGISSRTGLSFEDHIPYRPQYVVWVGPSELPGWMQELRSGVFRFILDHEPEQSTRLLVVGIHRDGSLVILGDEEGELCASLLFSRELFAQPLTKEQLGVIRAWEHPTEEHACLETFEYVESGSSPPVHTMEPKPTRRADAIAPGVFYLFEFPAVGHLWTKFLDFHADAPPSYFPSLREEIERLACPPPPEPVPVSLRRSPGDPWDIEDI